jgi:hypothetical protein
MTRVRDAIDEDGLYCVPHASSNLASLPFE